MEVWKDINGFEGLYQISDLGNVRSVSRRVINRRGGTTRVAGGITLKPWDNGNGYLVVTLNKSHKRVNRYVHRLVAESFLPNDEGKKCVNHIDYDTHNNSASNLEWCSQKENIAHSVEHMRKPRSRCRPSNTGEKYISEIITKGNSLRYRVQITRIGVSKTFKDILSAIQYRNEVVVKWQNQ